MQRLFFALCIVFVCVSCRDTRKDSAFQLVREWEGKEIRFPEQSVFTVQGKDTVGFNWSDADYKVLMYVDSTGCMSCKLQLSKWNDFIRETDSLHVSYIFYFNTWDWEGLQYVMRRDVFTYPVCFDKDDSLNRLNHFPSNVAFQTFLLDRNNKVLAIGNPILNEEIKNLYMYIIGGEDLSGTESINQTTVSLKPDSIDFGTFSLHTQQSRTVRLQNTGNNPLVVQGVNTSCGCIVVDYDKTPVVPGDSADIVVKYDAETGGYFKKTLTIHCNTSSSPLRVTLTGRAENEKDESKSI